MMREMTDTVIRDELSCATIGWNSCEWKRKPPTRRLRLMTKGVWALIDEPTYEGHSEDKEHVAEKTSQKRALHQFEFALRYSISALA